MRPFEIELDYQTILKKYLHYNNFGAASFRIATPQIYSDPIPLECKEYEAFQENTPNHTSEVVDDFLLRINNAGIVKHFRTPIILDHSMNKVLCHPSLDTLYGFEALFWENALRQINYNSVTQLNGRALLIDTLYGSEFFHFTISSISKFAKYLSFNQFLDDIDFFIFPENKTFISKWIDVLGIDKKKIIHLGNQERLIVDELIVPSNDCLISPQTIAFLRNILLISKPICDSKIFISRNASHNGRQLLNEQYLFDKYLLPLDFKYIQLENYSLRDQASIMASATHIVAPHGAGLTNLVFCAPGTSLLELFGSNWVVKCYAQFASLLGIKSYYHVSEDLEGNNFRIEENSFKNAINSFIHKW